MEVASERRAAGGAARLYAGDFFLLSVGGAEKFGSSQFGEAVRCVHGTREAQAVMEKHDQRCPIWSTAR